MQQNTLFDPRPAADARSLLRALLVREVCRVAPETADGLMARMVARADFEVAFVGLAGTALNRIGSPDAGLLTASELVDNAGRCIAASGLPTVVDAGTGFGNPINVLRTVSELARAGAAGVMLRDGVDPRRHRTCDAAVPVADMQARLRAARDAGGGELVLLAGMGGAAQAGPAVAELAARYRDAGAEIVHVGAIGSRAQARALAGALAGIPLACDLGLASEPDAGELGALGFRIAFVPHCGLMASVPAIEHTFGELARTGAVGHLRPHIADFRQFTDIAGLPEVQKLEPRYGVPDERRTAL